MQFLIVLIPLLGFLSCGFLGRFFGQRGAVLIPSLFMIWNICLSAFLFVLLSTNGEICTLALGNWITSGLFTVNWGFYIDNLTIMMLLIVNGVSTLVHIYASDYMAYDGHLTRFMSYLSLFTFIMLILITGDSLITIFLGWEGVGLCSYLLISFWFTRVLANKSAMKAMIVNRISDFGLTIGIIFVFFVFHSVDISVILGLVPFLAENIFFIFGNLFYVLDGIALLLFVGAMGKSAQLGLHTWLPDAMEGPTPVSALIHAATMVTAGVFLVIKTAGLFEYAPQILLIVSFIGAFTAFFAATAGLLQADLKKVIAYSTCSQLGYMFFVCGLSGYNFGLFHLVNHAFFKALLFLSAGAVIHSAASEQDMRKFGGMLKLIPFTYTMIVIGSLSLMGFPFLTGFYSKDLIIEIAYATYNQIGHALYWCGLITAFLTSFYSIRLLFLTLLTSSQTATVTIVKKIYDVPAWMMFSLCVLCLGSIFWGYLTKDFMVGVGSSFWNTSILILPENNHLVEAEFLPVGVKLIPFIWSLIIILFVFCIQNVSLYRIQKRKLLDIWFTKKYTILFWFLNNKWYFDTVFNRLLNHPTFKYSFILFVTLLDKGFLELVGPRGGFTVIYMASFKYILRQQSGLLYLYALSIGITLVLLIISFEYLYYFYSNNA